MRQIHFIFFSKAVKRSSVESAISLSDLSISARSVSKACWATGSITFGIGLNKKLPSFRFDWSNLNLDLNFPNHACSRHLNPGRSAMVLPWHANAPMSLHLPHINQS